MHIVMRCCNGDGIVLTVNWLFIQASRIFPLHIMTVGKLFTHIVLSSRSIMVLVKGR